MSYNTKLDYCKSTKTTEYLTKKFLCFELIKKTHSTFKSFFFRMKQKRFKLIKLLFSYFNSNVNLINFKNSPYPERNEEIFKLEFCKNTIDPVSARILFFKLNKKYLKNFSTWVLSLKLFQNILFDQIEFVIKIKYKKQQTLKIFLCIFLVVCLFNFLKKKKNSTINLEFLYDIFFKTTFYEFFLPKYLYLFIFQKQYKILEIFAFEKINTTLKSLEAARLCYIRKLKLKKAIMIWCGCFCNTKTIFIYSYLKKFDVSSLKYNNYTDNYKKIHSGFNLLMYFLHYKILNKTNY